MMHILVEVHGETADESRFIHKTRVGVPNNFEYEYRYDSIEDLPEPIRPKVELGPLVRTAHVYLREDTEPEWNRCPKCLWPHLLHGVLVEEAICQEGDDPTSYYHDHVDWVAPKYLKCSAPCGWQHDYDAKEFHKMDEVPKVMFRLHFLAEKERAHAPQ